MKVKVCGMAYTENMKQVASLLPDYLGFIFWEPSKRFVAEPLPTLPDTIKKVGVFVDALPEAIIARVLEFDLDLVQLHGTESPEFCASLKMGLQEKPIKVIKVFSIREAFDFDTLKGFEGYCDYFLFDTKGELPGGNGYAFDWGVLEAYKSDTPFFLSGGIGPEDLDKVQAFLETPAAGKCHAIDVNSKFELEPGRKNPESLERFLSTLKKEI